MCPLWPIHLFILYLFLLCPLWFLCTGVASAAAAFQANFIPENIKKLEEGAQQIINFTVPDISDLGFQPKQLDVITADCQIAQVVGNKTFYIAPSDVPENISFILTGLFLGHTTVKIRASDDEKTAEAPSKTAYSEVLSVSVIRPWRTIDNVFIISVAVLVGLNYINMGCSLDLDIVKATLKKPIGPAVGLVSQFLFMPLMSFALAHIIFTSPNMRLGLFTLGCSPGGGASNMWTYLLGGNLNLSITMTFLSNAMAFAAMPLWLFTLGRQIFDSSKINIPYTNITSSLVVLVLPVGIGLIFQRYFPKISTFCRRLLGPCSLFMILFIVIFGIFANLYMFKIFTWQVALGGLGVAWLGYIFGALLAKIFRFSLEDIIAISIETGVQNTGIAIVLLRFSLPQPDADLTSVIPVASAIMMPIPLVTILIIFRIRRWIKEKNKSSYDMYDQSGSTTPDSNKMLESSTEPAYIKIGNGV
uniref:Uncharacterized protein n=1 Tax=Strigamia maritima TaxID=126957 RepID=T1IRZ5_STRMM